MGPGGGGGGGASAGARREALKRDQVLEVQFGLHVRRCVGGGREEGEGLLALLEHEDRVVEEYLP